MVSEVEDKIVHEIIETADFNDIVLESFKNGLPDDHLAAYHFFARSQVPAGTAFHRDNENAASCYPQCNPKLCDGCLKCVFICPCAATHAKVIRNEDIEFYIEDFTKNETDRKYLKSRFSLFNGKDNFKYILAWDISKCKDCDECIKVCEKNALRKIEKMNQI